MLEVLTSGYGAASNIARRAADRVGQSSPRGLRDSVSADAKPALPPSPLRAYLPAANPLDWQCSSAREGKMVKTMANVASIGHRTRFSLGVKTSDTATSENESPVITPLRAVVAEDDVLLREGLASLLERSGFDVVGQAGDGAQLLETGPRQDAGCRGDRYPDAADQHHRGPRRRAGDPRRIPRHRDPGAVGARRRRARDGAAGQWTQRRLSAQEPGHRRDGFHRHTPADRQWGFGRGPRPGAGVGVGPAARRSARGAQRAGARGTGADGGGTIECRYRPSAVGHRGHRREARAQHPHQAEPARDRRRSPPRASGDRLPRGPLSRRRGRGLRPGVRANLDTKPEGRARRDQVGEVLLGMGGDQDHG